MLLAIECISVLPLANLQHAEIEQLVSYARQTYDSGLALTLTHTLTLTLTLALALALTLTLTLTLTPTLPLALPLTLARTLTQAWPSRAARRRSSCTSSARSAGSP